MLIRISLLKLPTRLAAMFMLLMSVSGCGGSIKADLTTGNWDELVAQLERAGFFKYVDPARVAEVKREITETKRLWVWPDEGYLNRHYSVDGEDMAEGGVLGLP